MVKDTWMAKSEPIKGGVVPSPLVASAPASVKDLVPINFKIRPVKL